MKNEIYNLVTIKDVQSDTEDILKVFSEMAAGRLKYDLNLLNYYDEVPIGYASTIVSVDKDSVEMLVHEHQALLIKHNNSTLIKCSHFYRELDVQCFAAYVNVAKRTVILHNFSYAQIRATRREAVRVLVHEEVPVTFSYDNVVLEGKIIDVSLNGISIKFDNLPNIAADQPGQVTFTLCDNLLEVPGWFVKCEPDGTDADCTFRMKPGRMSDRVIGHYIYQRQVEIIQQLKDGLLLD